MQSQFNSLAIFVERIRAPSRAQDAKTKEQTTSKGSAEFVRRFALVGRTFVVRNVMKAMQ
jgi:hypothetical protein